MNKSKSFLFTSESVSEGHPDKLADQISDGILDSYLEVDPNAKVACECLITTNTLVIAGEVTSNSKPKNGPIEIAKSILDSIGYNDEAVGFDHKKADYINLMHDQSSEINRSVLNGGAGDQGIIFGYACNETAELMPMPIAIAHQLMKNLSALRKCGDYPWLRPDAKCQVTCIYENNKPIGIDTIVLSTQHSEDIAHFDIRSVLIDTLIYPVVHTFLTVGVPNLLINPAGRFTIGGPNGDTGLTGRKIIADTYGGSCPHGGGAFSGKDPSKVDRSGAYAARYVAKHIVAAGLAERCTVQISYAIGRSEPVSLYLDLHRTGNTDEFRLTEIIGELFDLTPTGIIEKLNLRNPIYLPTATYGHFGNENYSWEQLDVEILKSLNDLK